MYRVSQEERHKLREGVPYVKLYRYNPKHLYPKLNGYGDNDQRSLKRWQLLHTYWLPNTYWNWQEYVVSVMLISVLNSKLTCEWHKAIKLNYKNTRTSVTVVRRFPSTVRRQQLVHYLVTSELLWAGCAVTHSPRSLNYDASLPSLRCGRVWRHGRLTVRGNHKSSHISMAIISVTVQLWI
jgi:hypothetical protein